MGVEVFLKNRIKAAGLNGRDLAERLNRKYSTVTAWLNGYADLPREYRSRIEAILNEMENAKKTEAKNG